MDAMYEISQIDTRIARVVDYISVVYITCFVLYRSFDFYAI